MNISIFFGGESDERGISINSARFIYELLFNIKKNITLYYIDQNFKVYSISDHYIYSNTPDDFACFINPIENFWDHFKTSFAIPLIHGRYGEDGEIQQILEKKQIPFLFSGSKFISKMFLKYQFCQTLWNCGFKSWNSCLFSKNPDKLKELHKNNEVLVLKPNNGGSSINVFLSRSYEQSMEIIQNHPNIDFLIEEKHQGKEFSISVVNGKAYMPVEITKTGEIFDHKSKYFPVEHTHFLNPPNFSLNTIKKIQNDSEDIFQIFHAEDFIRIDGWVLENEEIIYTECNPIPAMEANSLFFQSISDNPYEIFENILNKKFIQNKINLISLIKDKDINIPILFGNNNSEKDVSLFSGANTCIKLFNLNKFKPIACLFFENNVYILPFFLIFKHSIHDLMYTINNIEIFNEISHKKIEISKIHIDDFIQRYRYIFIALHGDIGENGTIQKMLENKNVRFNGSNSSISRLCMNKYETIELIEKNIKNIYILKRFFIKYPEYKIDDINLCGKDFILKPNNDGCSTGVVKIKNIFDLNTYINAMKNGVRFVKINEQYVQMPNLQDLILEEYIETDKINIEYSRGSSKIYCNSLNGWVELTVGVVDYEVLSPSITLSNNDILTAEEKFQKGIGVNITPPPEFIISLKKQQYIKDMVLNICKFINLNTYARLDIFFNRITGDFILIEINTLPALTFSTVIFQQAAHSGYTPEKFIEKIMKYS